MQWQSLQDWSHLVVLQLTLGQSHVSRLDPDLRALLGFLDRDSQQVEGTASIAVFLRSEGCAELDDALLKDFVA